MAIARLRNAGEYAIPFMVDAIDDDSRKDEFAAVSSALYEVGRDAVRPLTAALEDEDPEVRSVAEMALQEIWRPEI